MTFQVTLTSKLGAVRQAFNLARLRGNTGAVFSAIPSPDLQAVGVTTTPTEGTLGEDGVTRADALWLAAFVDSTASAPAAVDGPVGFLSDGEVTVGAALTVKSINQSEGATVSDLGGGIYKLTYVPGAADPFIEFRYEYGTPIIGKSFYLAGEVWTDPGQPTDLTFFSYATPSIMDVQAPFFTLETAAKRFSYISRFQYATDTGFSVRYDARELSSGGYFYYRLPVVRLVSGSNATQNSGPNKPVMRRGLVNRLTFSNDLTAGVWGSQFGATQNAGVMLFPGTGAQWLHGPVLTAIAPFSWAVKLSGSGTISIYSYNATDGNFGIRQVTLSAKPTIFVSHANPSASDSYHYVGRLAGDTATSVEFHGAGIFAGAITAAQIEAVGGIPLTTNVAASSSNGNFAVEFGGTVQALSLTSTPATTAGSSLIIVGCRADSRQYMGAACIGATASSSGFVGFTNSGQAFYDFWGGTQEAGVISSQTYLGEPVVMTGRKVGNSMTLRVNGQVVGTVDASGIGQGVPIGGFIGAYADRYGNTAPFNGVIWESLIFDGEFTDDEVFLLECSVACLCPIPGQLRF